MFNFCAKVHFFFELHKFYTKLGNFCTPICAKNSNFAANLRKCLTQNNRFMKKIFTFLFAGLLSMSSMQGVVKVHTIGDSTMDDYPETTDKRGWGMYLGSFFDSNNVKVNNCAHSGRDTRTFYEDDWTSVENQMSSGDYVIIQFAHNDEGTVTNGLDMLEYRQYCKDKGIEEPAASEKRGTNPQTTYRAMLKTYIDEARAKGVNPILVAPICRAYFSNGNISRAGQHDLGDKFWKIEGGELLKDQSVPATDHSMDYVEAMRIVAAAENVPFINLTEGTRQLYTSYGQEQCLSLLFCSGDKTHTNAMGANLIARMAADSLKHRGILAEYIDIPTATSANPSSIAIGETYSGVAQNREFLLTGFGLSPETGTLSIEADGDLLISTDKEHYAKSASVNYAGGSLFQKVYVRATYMSEGEKSNKVTVKSGGVMIVEVPVTATVLSLVGGSTVSATWPISSTSSAKTATVEGPISAEMTLSNMCANDTKADFVYASDPDTKITMVRFHNGTSKTAWPANEIDENAERYIDFSITAPATQEIRITKISMDIAAHSTSTMCCHIRTGFGDGFTGGSLIYESTSLPYNTSSDPATIGQLEFTPTLTVKAGETLHVRLYPWHNLNEAKSGKYVCLKNVKIEGKAFDPATGMEEVSDRPFQGKKIMRNGMLFIVRPDGTMYNILGSQIR